MEGKVKSSLLFVRFAGTSSQGRGFGLQMAQAGFSSHLVKVSDSQLHSYTVVVMCDK